MQRGFGTEAVARASERTCGGRSLSGPFLRRAFRDSEFDGLVVADFEEGERGAAEENWVRMDEGGGEEGTYPELIAVRISLFAGSSYRMSSPSSIENPSSQKVRLRTAVSSTCSSSSSLGRAEGSGMRVEGVSSEPRVWAALR